MKTRLISLLLLLPTLALAQFINLPNNEFPILTFNPANLTDHTTDVSNIQGYVLQTGFFQDETEFWGYDATGPTLTPQNFLSDIDAVQSYFATFHDNAGNMLWYLVSDQSGTVGVSYGTSKIGFDQATMTYKICVEYSAPTGTALIIVSSTGSGFGIGATSQNGLLTFEVDMSGNILVSSLAVVSSSPILLGDIDIDNSGSGEMYIHATRVGFINQAFVGQHTVGVNGMSAGTTETGGVGSTARGIDVEDGKVFIVGDFVANCDWGGGPFPSGATQDVYVAEFDLAFTLLGMTVADALNYAESYDIEAFPSGGNTHVYVSGSIEEESMAWFGPLGAAPPGATHGFIQAFWPDLNTPTNYAIVLANAPGEFFRMTDLEETEPAFLGIIDIGGNLNHSSPVYEVFSGGSSTAYPFSTATVPEAGFALRVNDHPDPIWTNISTLEVSMSNPAPTITCISGYEDDIFVGGYKNEDILLTPIGQPNAVVPNLGNTNMNAFITYILSNGSDGEFYKNGEQPTAARALEEEQAWSIYPNPTSEYIYFSTSDATQFNDIRLKDITGRTIKAWNGSEAVNGLSVAGLPAGLYLIEVEQNGAYETHRLVIE